MAVFKFMAQTITCIECGCEFDDDREACPVCGTTVAPCSDKASKPNETSDISNELPEPASEPTPPKFVAGPPEKKPGRKPGKKLPKSAIIAGAVGILVVMAILACVFFVGLGAKGPALPKQESFDGSYGSSAALIAGGGVAVPVEDGMFYARYGDAGSEGREPGIYWDSNIAPKNKALEGVLITSDCGYSLNYYKNSLVYLASTDGDLPASFEGAREIRVINDFGAEEPVHGSTIYKTSGTKTIGCMQVYNGSAYFTEKASDSSYEVKSVSLEGGHASKIIYTLSTKPGSDAWMFIEDDTLYVAYSAKENAQAGGDAAQKTDSTASALATPPQTAPANSWKLDALSLQEDDAESRQVLRGEGTLGCALYEDGWLYYALSGEDSPLYCLSDKNERRDAAVKNASRLTACGKYVMAIGSDGKAMLMHTSSNIALDVTDQDTQADIDSVSASMSGCAMTDEYMFVSELNGRMHLYPPPEECFEEAG